MTQPRGVISNSAELLARSCVNKTGVPQPMGRQAGGGSSPQRGKAQQLLRCGDMASATGVTAALSGCSLVSDLCSDHFPQTFLSTLRVNCLSGLN